MGHSTPVSSGLLIISAVLGSLLCLTLGACGAALPSPAISPADTAIPTEPSKTYASGGLGLSQIEWEKRHGAPNSKGYSARSYENNKYVVSFIYGEDDPVDYILRQYQEGNMDSSKAHAEARAMLPDDSRFVRTDQDVDYYHSESLIKRLEDAYGNPYPWEDATPGEITIWYRYNHKSWEMTSDQFYAATP